MNLCWISLMSENSQWNFADLQESLLDLQWPYLCTLLLSFSSSCSDLELHSDWDLFPPLSNSHRSLTTLVGVSLFHLLDRFPILISSGPKHRLIWFIWDWLLVLFILLMLIFWFLVTSYDFHKFQLIQWQTLCSIMPSWLVIPPPPPNTTTTTKHTQNPPKKKCIQLWNHTEPYLGIFCLLGNLLERILVSITCAWHITFIRLKFHLPFRSRITMPNSVTFVISSIFCPLYWHSGYAKPAHVYVCGSVLITSAFIICSCLLSTPRGLEIAFFSEVFSCLFQASLSNWGFLALLLSDHSSLASTVSGGSFPHGFSGGARNGLGRLWLWQP